MALNDFTASAWYHPNLSSVGPPLESKRGAYPVKPVAKNRQGNCANTGIQSCYFKAGLKTVSAADVETSERKRAELEQKLQAACLLPVIA